MDYYDVEEMPNCCAVGVIEKVGDLSLSQIKEAINSIKTLNKKRDAAGAPIHDSIFARGAVVATTNQKQTNAINNLKKLRFTKAFTARNPKTGNMVTLWYKLLTRPRRKINE